MTATNPFITILPPDESGLFYLACIETPVHFPCSQFDKFQIRMKSRFDINVALFPLPFPKFEHRAEGRRIPAGERGNAVNRRAFAMRRLVAERDERVTKQCTEHGK